MQRMTCCVAALALAVLGGVAGAATFSLTAVTNTTPNYAPPILIMGSVTMSPGEVMISPTLMSSHGMPFLSNYSAGFNGSGQSFNPGFLAWNGTGTYTGPILNHQVSANNLGYSGGMPVGLYGSNVFGPGGQSWITLHYIDIAGLQQSVNLPFAINVVPAPGAMALMGLGGVVMMRRRR